MILMMSKLAIPKVSQMVVALVSIIRSSSDYHMGLESDQFLRMSVSKPERTGTVRWLYCKVNS